jgi:hypothetical protein
MANVGPQRVTPGFLLKKLHDKAEIDHILTFLRDLNGALGQSTSPTVSSGRSVWVPDIDRELSHGEKLPLIYNYRDHNQKTDIENKNQLDLTDVASLLNDQRWSVKIWLERNSKSPSQSVPSVLNLIRDIRDGELLDAARVERGKKIQGVDGLEGEAQNDGYSESALWPSSSLNLLNEAHAYDRLVQIAQALLEAAEEWERAHAQEEGAQATSITPLIDRVKQGNPLDDWAVVKEFAVVLSEYTE